MVLTDKAEKCRAGFYSVHPELNLEANSQLLLEEMKHLGISPESPANWEIALLSTERRLAHLSNEQVQQMKQDRKAITASTNDTGLPAEYTKQRLQSRAFSNSELKELIQKYGRSAVYARLEGRG